MELTANILQLSPSGIILAALVIIQFGFFFLLVIRLRKSEQSTRKLHTSMFGLMKRIEGMTAEKRERMLVEFDLLLDRLSMRLPTALAARAGDAIFEAEKRLLSRIIELERTITPSAENREELDYLVKSLESLEQTMVSLTASTVHEVLLESRKQLFTSQYSPLADSVDVFIE